MSKKKIPARMNVAVKPMQSSQAEALKKVEKKAFVACVLGIAGAPLAFIGLGIIPGIIALVQRRCGRTGNARQVRLSVL